MEKPTPEMLIRSSHRRRISFSILYGFIGLLLIAGFLAVKSFSLPQSEILDLDRIGQRTSQTLFIEIHEQDFDTLPPTFNIKPRAVYSIDPLNKLLIYDKNFTMDNSLVIIGHTIDFNGKGRNGTVQAVSSFALLPSEYLIAKVNNEVRLLSSSLKVLQADGQGTCKFFYMDQAFTLKPGESKIFNASRAMSGITYKTSIEIFNHGFLAEKPIVR